MIKGLAHIGLYIKDIERSKQFYSDILGFEATCQVHQEDGTKICMMEKGSCILELVEFAEYQQKVDGFFDHVALEVDDIRSAMSVLSAKGIEFESEDPILDDIYNGVYYIMFKGPDGEQIELDQIL